VTDNPHSLMGLVFTIVYLCSIKVVMFVRVAIRFKRYRRSVSEKRNNLVQYLLDEGHDQAVAEYVVDWCVLKNEFLEIERERHERKEAE